MFFFGNGLNESQKRVKSKWPFDDARKVQILQWSHNIGARLFFWESFYLHTRNVCLLIDKWEEWHIKCLRAQHHHQHHQNKSSVEDISISKQNDIERPRFNNERFRLMWLIESILLPNFLEWNLFALLFDCLMNMCDGKMFKIKAWHVYLVLYLLLF